MAGSPETVPPSMDKTFLPFHTDFRHIVRTQRALSTFPVGKDRSSYILGRAVRSFRLATLQLKHPLHQEYLESPATLRAGRFPFFAIGWAQESPALVDRSYPC